MKKALEERERLADTSHVSTVVLVSTTQLPREILCAHAFPIFTAARYNSSLMEVSDFTITGVNTPFNRLVHGKIVGSCRECFRAKPKESPLVEATLRLLLRSHSAEFHSCQDSSTHKGAAKASTRKLWPGPWIPEVYHKKPKSIFISHVSVCNVAHPTGYATQLILVEVGLSTFQKKRNVFLKMCLSHP